MEQPVNPGEPSLGDKLKSELGRGLERLLAAKSEPELRNVRAEFLGKNGGVADILRGLGKALPEERRAIGEAANKVKAELEAAFEKALKDIARAARDADLNAAPFDLTLPGRVAVPRGHHHPITRVQDEILDIFRSLGFEVAWGPEVELEENNFTKLAFPPDHPATDMQDSFWVKIEGAKPGVRALTGAQGSCGATHV